MTFNLSKSKLLAFRQCPKRLWLEVHHPELREDSAASRVGFQIGNTVGEVARRVFDPSGMGALMDAQRDGYAEALAQTGMLLEGSRPIFEAGFSAAGAIAFADVLLPGARHGKRVWHMIEVKSSTQVKDYHRDDAAIQSFVARKANVPLESIKLAYIDSSWVYPGSKNYDGLFGTEDLTDETLAREGEVTQWISDAHQCASLKQEPSQSVGTQCTSPFECGFLTYCSADLPQAEFPISWLPRIQAKALKEWIAQPDVLDLAQVPDDLLNERQLRVKQHTLAGTTYFDREGAAKALAGYLPPICFLDFETIQFAVPIWAGTRPYQQIPFQFSLHRFGSDSKLEHQEFLDLSGDDPSHALAHALIAKCGIEGPIFAYNASFEKSRIKELAERFPDLKDKLLALVGRIADLLPFAEQHYYHPSQQGSWSIKRILSAIAPDLSYQSLQGVKDGSMAMDAYLEAIDPATPVERKANINEQLLRYCELDTLAMVRLWEVFSGRK